MHRKRDVAWSALVLVRLLLILLVPALVAAASQPAAAARAGGPDAARDATVRVGGSVTRTLRVARPGVLWLTARAQRCAVRVTVTVRGRRSALWVRSKRTRGHRLGELRRGRHRAVLAVRAGRCRGARLRGRLELRPGRERPGTPPAPTTVVAAPGAVAPGTVAAGTPGVPGGGAGGAPAGSGGGLGGSGGALAGSCGSPSGPAGDAQDGGAPGGPGGPGGSGSPGDPDASGSPLAPASPFATRPLFSDPWSPAAADAGALRAEGRCDDAALVERIAQTPRSLWLADWTGDDPGPEAAQYVARAHAAGAVPVLVAYRLPDRDCGGASAGGAASEAAYRAWVEALATALEGPAAVVVEPDALAWLDCVRDDPERSSRTLRLVRHAAEVLGARPGVGVYLDAGHSGWNEADVVARRLVDAGVALGDGFALNVSNFRATADELAYGHRISSLTGGARFVVDTSRNGRGPTQDAAWCNPPGRGLGRTPTLATGDPLADAFLWVKVPGESDGPCNGGPPAGTWWREGALALARNAATP